MGELWRTLVSRADPALGEHIQTAKASVSKATGDLTVYFDCDVPVAPEQAARLRREISQAFPRSRVEVRFSYLTLHGEALEDIDDFRSLICRDVAVHSPGSLPMLDWSGAHWRFEDDTLVVNVPSESARAFLTARGTVPMIEEAVSRLFGIACRAALTTAENEEALMQRIRDLRSEQDEMLKIMPSSPQKRETRPDETVLGKAFSDKPLKMRDLAEDTGRCCVMGEVSGFECREAKNGSTKIVTFIMTDYTSSVACKLFLGGRRAQGEASVQKQLELVTQALRDGNWAKARGSYQYDTFRREFSLIVNDLMRVSAPVRTDDSPEKRVELHAHTKMSAMDAVVSASDLIKRAASWGMKAIAVTDHGVVQAFPEAFSAAAKAKIKLIPGCEGYLIEDAPVIVTGAEGISLDDAAYTVLDFETTGLTPSSDKIIEIGAVRIEHGKETAFFSELVDPERELPEKVQQLTHITPADLTGRRTIREVLPEFAEFIRGSVLVAHNADFDTGFLFRALEDAGLPREYPVLDTLALVRNLYPSFKSYKLGSVCKELRISLANAHRAVHDARATSLVLLRALDELRDTRGVRLLSDINTCFQTDAAGKCWHIILLAKDQTGITNLYRIVSESHLNYFHRTPRIPRAVIERCREGLIVGSACEAGELYRAVAAKKPMAELKKIASFYDYLEIQPIGNNAFMLRNGEASSEEELRGFNRTIVQLGRELGKPVCATCDVHFLDARDAVFRSVVMTAKEFEDADKQPPLFLRTTEEMLREFDYLGEETAREVVIENTNRIADMVGSPRIFIPHPEGKETFQPVWPDAADELRSLTLDRAHAIFGDTLPEIVQARIDKELGSIIGYGFSTLYMIAVKLVRKSNGDGYIVGSRGSVGSSYVAYLSGITEVDSLPPHYVCPSCKHSEFDVPAQYTCGLDLPPKNCPVCGQPMDKDGFNIPFEVFLGFKGDKVPDIDLNFSGEYQAAAHAYIKELFGEQYCYRAGTIGTIAEKTAYGYVLKYQEKYGLNLPEAEKERLARGITEVKRTTGQHPAGMVVVPKEYEIYQFTPVQHPADDMTTGTVTTHFDFNSMHDVLVKLDVLGHDDPTMLRRLQEMTGIAPQDVPLHDPEVFRSILSLFSGTEALGITPEQLGVARTGTLGVPEFGTPFVRGMLRDTKPTTMEELVRISGLSHGTDVWLGNAADLVRSGVPLRECICTRDDIMLSLIALGVKSEIAFKTMESVRKGRGLTEAMEQAILSVDAPDWFIDSCKKIKYMFPKSHAVAYVTMALRIAYFKIFYPAEYYTCYLMRNAEHFNALTMAGKTEEELRRLHDELSARDETTDKEDDEITLLQVLIEMYVRGVRIRSVDAYESSADAYLLTPEGILPPISSLPQIGSSAAQTYCSSLAAARKSAGPDFRFRSREDMLRRGIARSTIDMLVQSGTLERLTDTDQISLFDSDFSAGV